MNTGLKKWNVNLFLQLTVSSSIVMSVNISNQLCMVVFKFYFHDTIYAFEAGTLSAYKYGKENPSELCCLVVDCGYSFTHLIPYVQGKKITEFVHRIEIGGKVLTNHLKDIISYR